jgi:hypothetical protein
MQEECKFLVVLEKEKTTSALVCSQSIATLTLV